MPKLTFFRHLTLLFMFSVFFYPANAAEPKEQGVLPLQDIRTFTDIFQRIRDSYVEEVDDKTDRKSVV